MVQINAISFVFAISKKVYLLVVSSKSVKTRIECGALLTDICVIKTNLNCTS
jgi:hypothetical protein